MGCERPQVRILLPRPLPLCYNSSVEASNITTELLVEDMKKTLDFYKDVLDFEVKMSFPEEDPFFAIIRNNKAELMLYTREKFLQDIPDFAKEKMGGTFALYIRVKDIVELFDDLKNKVKIIQELYSTSYVKLEFSFYDCNGYVLMLHE